MDVPDPRPDPRPDPWPVLDLRGLRCPLPVLKSAKRLAPMPPGARLWIETTDPLAGIDIPAFAQASGHRLVETQRTETGHRFLLERGVADGPLPP